MLRSVSVSHALSRRSGPLAAGVLLLLALAGPRPAYASLNTTSPITLGPTDTLTLAGGDSVDTRAVIAPAITVNGGTLNITGGSVLGNASATATIVVNSGTVTISGGSVGGALPMSVSGGTVAISGGSVSGDLALYIYS